MNIKKLPEGGIKLENSITLYLDPTDPSKVLVDRSAAEAPETKGKSISIITDPNKNINHDRVFNLPGEYELQGVIIKGFASNPYAFLIKDELSLLYFVSQPSETILAEIKTDCDRIEVIVAGQVKNPEQLREKLGADVFITTAAPTQLPSVKTEKTNLIKLNPRKLTPACYYLQ